MPFIILPSHYHFRKIPLCAKLMSEPTRKFYRRFWKADVRRAFSDLFRSDDNQRLILIPSKVSLRIRKQWKRHCCFSPSYLTCSYIMRTEYDMLYMINYSLSSRWLYLVLEWSWYHLRSFALSKSYEGTWYLRTFEGTEGNSYLK